MYKAGIIGDRASALGFMALGFSVLEAADADAAREQLHRAARSGEYAVLFLTEKYAKALETDIALYKDVPLPAITVIPGADGGEGYGMAQLKGAVERAIGADILFKE